MKLGILRQGVIALLLASALMAAFVAALPWIASTRIVRDRIAYELSVWSGYRVELGEAPGLTVWPTVRATLHDVALHEWGARNGRPVMEAERVEIALSAFPALRGDIVFSSMVLTRPLLLLRGSGDEVTLPVSPGGGRMTQAVAAARALVTASPSSPDISALPRDSFGTIEFTDGRIVVATPDGDRDAVTSISGKLAWPSLNRAATLAANGIWRGENIAIEASSAQPLILLGHGTAPATASVRSSLLNASFDGVASLSGDAYLDGTVNLSSPSLRRMLEWSRTDIAPGAAIGAVAMSGRLTGNVRRIKMENLRLEIGGNSGVGVLNASMADSPPSITGTLDFGRLDIGSFLTAFSPLASGKGTIYETIDTSFSEQISLDLRLSADNAVLGALTLGEVAATAQVKGGLAAFDISDSSALGGILQTGLRIDQTDTGKTVEMRVMATQIDTVALAKVTGLTAIVPRGRGDASIILKGSGRDWNSVMGNAEGSVTATVGRGSIAGLDLKGFREKWSAQEFFPLADLAEGTLPMQGLEFRATVKGGIARIDRAKILLEQEMIWLDGIIPYFGRALALSGHLGPVGPDGMLAEATNSFFIGGGWDSPYVSPVIRWHDEE